MKKFNIKEYFKKLRFDINHHLGLGDIRLSCGQQEEIIEVFEQLTKKLNKETSKK